MIWKSATSLVRRGSPSTWAVAPTARSPLEAANFTLPSGLAGPLGSGARLPGPAPLPSPDGGVEDHFAEADRGGRHLHAFVFGDELEGLLQGEEQRWGQPDGLV